MLKNYTKVKVDEDDIKRYRNDEGKCHRLDGPAVEFKDGSMHWVVNNKYHRNIDPAAEWADGIKQWFFKYELHRIGSSNFVFDKYWYIHDEEYTKQEYFNKVWDI